MTPESQRIAIAEACGWTHHPDGVHWIKPAGYTLYPLPHDLPNYLSDLNAMHEAEKTFNDDEVKFGKFIKILYAIMEPTRHVVHATAAQRAEAFLRTIGKWEDSK